MPTTRALVVGQGRAVSPPRRRREGQKVEHRAVGCAADPLPQALVHRLSVEPGILRLQVRELDGAQALGADLMEDRAGRRTLLGLQRDGRQEGE
ncbi:MAG TPA: hypothetical protein VJQ44_14215 [Gemmatimonadales bacterium]|nr:hypothetical protein [Gemmatimonadales bacterium]